MRRSQFLPHAVVGLGLNAMGVLPQLRLHDAGDRAAVLALWQDAGSARPGEVAPPRIPRTVVRDPTSTVRRNTLTTYSCPKIFQDEQDLSPDP